MTTSTRRSGLGIRPYFTVSGCDLIVQAADLQAAEKFRENLCSFGYIYKIYISYHQRLNCMYFLAVYCCG